MTQGNQQLKIERNLRIRYNYNCDTDGLMNEFRFMSSAEMVKQS